MLTTGVDGGALQLAGDALHARVAEMRESVRLLDVAMTSLATEWSATGSLEFSEVFEQYRAVVLAGIQAIELLASGVTVAGSTYDDAEAAVQASVLAMHPDS